MFIQHIATSAASTSKAFTPCSTVSIVNFEQVNAGWVTRGAPRLKIF